jgi:hypothetical protein
MPVLSKKGTSTRTISAETGTMFISCEGLTTRHTV